MKSVIPVAILLIVLFTGCKKNAQNIIIKQADKNPPTAFTVKVTDREDTFAQIRWTHSVSADTTPVTYSVTLNGVKIVGGLTDTTYKILNLVDTLTYAGQVIATDKRGSMTTDTFTVHKAPGVVYASANGGFGCYTLGADQRWFIAGSFTAIPVISNDTVFAQGANVVALNAKTGAQYWSATINEVGTGLVYYGGMLFTNLAGSNRIIAINAKTGNIVWALNAGGAYPPAVSKGILFYESADGLGGAILVALDARTGLPKWNINFHGNTAAPAAFNGTVFVQSSATDPTTAGGYLYARDAATGGYKWSAGFNGEVGVNYQSRPVVVGSTVYFLGFKNEFGTPNTLYAVNMSDGTPKWQKLAFTGAAYGTVFKGPDGIYVNAYQITEKFDLNTGALLWSVPNSSDLSGVSDVTVTPGTVYFHQYGGPGSYLQPLSSATGTAIAGAQNVPVSGGYVIVIDGKAYYPYGSGMNAGN